MKLGDKHTVNGKEYVAVCTPVVSCNGCAFKKDTKPICGGVVLCEAVVDGQTQEIIWIEVKR